MINDLSVNSFGQNSSQSIITSCLTQKLRFGWGKDSLYKAIFHKC